MHGNRSQGFWCRDNGARGASSRRREGSRSAVRESCCRRSCSLWTGTSCACRSRPAPPNLRLVLRPSLASPPPQLHLVSASAPSHHLRLLSPSGPRRVRVLRPAGGERARRPGALLPIGRAAPARLAELGRVRTAWGLNRQTASSKSTRQISAKGDPRSGSAVVDQRWWGAVTGRHRGGQGRAGPGCARRGAWGLQGRRGGGRRSGTRARGSPAHVGAPPMCRRAASATTRRPRCKPSWRARCSRPCGARRR